jgi:hypothetical protein
MRILAVVAHANCCVEAAGSSSIVRGLWRAWTALMASALGTARPSGPACISLSLSPGWRRGGLATSLFFSFYDGFSCWLGLALGAQSAMLPQLL